MRKKKKNILIILLVILFVALISILFYFLVRTNNKNSLSVLENKWIESNKYNVIDIAVINDLPILSYDGKGMVYDYLDYVSKKHSLKFNIISYKLDGTVDYNYKMALVDNPSTNDIVLLKNNLVLVTTDDTVYTTANNIINLKIGIISSDKDLLNEYLNDSIELVEYESYYDLKNSLEELEVDGIIIPKLIITKEVIEKDYNVAFHFNDLNKFFVLSVNGASELNSILTKKFNLWKESSYGNSYNNNLLDNYFEFKNISDSEQKKLYSKKYEYGFIDYGIYNILKDNKISGYNEVLLKDFNQFSGLSIKYTKYNSISKMVKDFNSGELDFIMNIVNSEILNSEIYETTGIFSKNLAMVSGITNKDIVDSLYSLKDKEVLTIKDSYLEKYLLNNGIKVKSYNNLKDLTTDFSDNDIAVLDLDNYVYYKTSAFKDTKINSLISLNEKYNFIISDKDNYLFEDIFNFYLKYTSENELIFTNYQDISYENINTEYILILIIIALCIYLVVDFSNHVKYMIKRIRKNRKINLSKEDKLKYIDQLTSLKNRAYLNSKIESWDDSNVYPQAVIIIDLNNISYINDNYGREEGDKVITEAANILIQNQLQNSEIIRTDGNEFLVYLVGYNEKEIVSYLRKLTKELKNLSHGFGAASGYSIIDDAIKTFDDAVNEATIDMKTNKEDIEY